MTLKAARHNASSTLQREEKASVLLDGPVGFFRAGLELLLDLNPFSAISHVWLNYIRICINRLPQLVRRKWG